MSRQPGRFAVPAGTVAPMLQVRAPVRGNPGYNCPIGSEHITAAERGGRGLAAGSDKAHGAGVHRGLVELDTTAVVECARNTGIARSLKQQDAENLRREIVVGRNIESYSR